MKNQDIYEEPITIVHENGNISHVYRPILTDEERARRMRRIAHSAERLLRETLYPKKETAI